MCDVTASYDVVSVCTILDVASRRWQHTSFEKEMNCHLSADKF